jgi:hypothetical protein
MKPPRDFPFAGLAKLQALRARIGTLTPGDLIAADRLEALQREAFEGVGGKSNAEHRRGFAERCPL